MKIAIYEPIHLELIIPLCDFFYHREDQVFFFTSSAFEEDLKTVLGPLYQQFSFTYTESSERRMLFRRKVRCFFDSEDFDLVILNSIDSRHLFVYHAIRRKSARVVITIHDVNNFFKAKLTLYPKRILRVLGKQLLAKLAHGYIVNARSMQEYIKSNHLTPKPVFCIPPVITKAVFPDLEKHPFTITVSGSIDKKRRDYKLVLSVFTVLAQQYPLVLRLVLAGRPVDTYGKEITEAARRLKQKGFLIQFFNDEIPENQFQELVSQTTLLWSPLCIKTSIHDDIDETYGITKISGNIYDAIRHGKPMLIPEGLQVPAEILSSCIPYSSGEDAIQKLREILNNRAEFNEIAKTAFYNTQQFSLAAGILRLENMINEVMSLTHPAKHGRRSKK